MSEGFAKTAVVLYNLGGPDSLKAVRPFLFNLFNDPAIIELPQPMRFLLATLISTLRNKKAKGIYQHMGGKSPILEETQAQAEALEKKLNEAGKGEFKTFICMRHWNPMTELVVKKVKAYAPDRVIMLPLYPQFSATTTGSSFAAWQVACEKHGLEVLTSKICCYPSEKSMVASHVRLIKEMYWKAAEYGKPRILFSAHGLPEKCIQAGDPYQFQVEKTVASIVQVLAIDELDYSICYQSRVGRLQWIGPSTEEEITLAGEERVPVMVVPVAFVSEHSETLVELDIDYAAFAKKRGVPGYWRVPALGAEPFFIDSLSDLCLNAPADDEVRSETTQRLCPRTMGRCLCTV